MKMQGHTFDAPNTVICALPRGNGKDVIFIAQAILSWDEFDTLCPFPKAPQVVKPGGKIETNFQDKDYIASCARRDDYRMGWLILRSLEPTPGLSWETVDMRNPKTYMNFRQELKDAFFSAVEIGRIENTVLEANSISEARVQEARENFARGQQDSKATPSGPSTEPASTQSGEPANE